MISRYYELPLKFGKLVDPRREDRNNQEDLEDQEDQDDRKYRNRDLDTCDRKKSIAQNIYLIITSKFKEHRYDESYGCEIWDMDFELIASENMWLERVRKSIYRSVSVHEKRLCDIKVDVDISQDEDLTSLKSTKTVKKRLTINVNGTITETGEEFPFTTSIYLGPLSLD